MISIQSVDEKNFEEVISLSIHDYQKKYVASITHSLAQCYIYRDNNDVFPFAILNDNYIIGFILFDEDIENKELLVWRLIIDKKYQQKGYGKKLLIYLLDIFSQLNTYNFLTINCVESNIEMYSLLQSLNFEFTKEDIVTKELLFRYAL